MASLLLLLSQLVRPETTCLSSSSSRSKKVAATIRFTAQQPHRYEVTEDNEVSEDMENLQECRVRVESVWP
ncbi:hypothetical protein I3843_01G101200 [Carya illinoinensis]|uniref:Uncharacterized protein n=1 Tax=Carya illinoinensis TaxID=32201 RepID=A0A922G263_CARIL|nr:hypothetical protein I3842_01G107900 [Carya illinoinensis]KAG7995281.1 hypothetical protein I3843_01G101200 [Carya illinoinensis]